MNKQNIFALAIIVAATFTISYLLTGGLNTIKLGKAPSLAYAVSESLVLSGIGSDLPQMNSDYTLDNTRYFENKAWVVAKITPKRFSSDSVYVILKRIDGYYQPVVAPANEFSASYVYSLPSEIGQYLNQQGLLHG